MQILKLVIFLLPLSVQAAAPLNKNMQLIADTLRALLTPALSETTYADKSKAKEIQGHLLLLEKLFLENKTHFDTRKGDWRLNHRTMVGLVAQSRKALISGNPEASRQMVKSIPGLCLSCHGQDHIQAKVFNGQLPDTGGPLVNAEFALATRQPLKAEKYLAEFLAQKNLRPDNRETIGALRGELQVHVNLKRSPEQIRQWLKLRGSSFKADPEITNLLSRWQTGLRKTELAFPKPLGNVSAVPGALLRGLGSREPELGLISEPEEEIVYLHLREELHRLLAATPSGSDQAQLYYWLSFCERAVGYNFFYSLSDGYLKACMDEWPELPTAKKCFREYESFVEFAFTGSSGTDIPADVKIELESYRKKVGVK